MCGFLAPAGASGVLRTIQFSIEIQNLFIQKLNTLEAKYFYSSSLSASLGVHNKYYAYSSSFNRSTFDTKYDQFSALANLMFEGCKQTNKTTVLNSYSSDFNPVETNDTTPLRIVSQEPGKSKLRIE